MICRCFGQTFDLTAWAARTRATAELIAGVSDYDAYLRHIAATHPDMPALTRDAFFRARQAARFGGGGLRCC
jgi:uncharacterized short protein YbdD (DUF466 family)